MKKTFIVIPVFNEAPVLEKVINDVKRQGYKNIIVVDDGSTDDTYLKAKKAKTISLRHFINRGKGAAIVTGVNAAVILKSDYIITLDGDGQHDPKDIKAIEKKLNQGYDIVLGYRNFSSNKMPFFRMVGNKLANLMVFLLYFIKVKDSQSGFRGYTTKAIQSMNTLSEKYEIESHIIREMAKNKLKYAQIPIKVLYTDYSNSKKQKQNFTNGIQTIIKMLSSL
jgi:glycosyltransferase involved in cell wall biosynthesis